MLTQLSDMLHFDLPDGYLPYIHPSLEKALDRAAKRLAVVDFMMQHKKQRRVPAMKMVWSGLTHQQRREYYLAVYNQVNGTPIVHQQERRS